MGGWLGEQGSSLLTRGGRGGALGWDVTAIHIFMYISTGCLNLGLEIYYERSTFVVNHSEVSSFLFLSSLSLGVRQKHALSWEEELELC